MTLLPATLSLKTNLPQTFVASGGVAPFVYSVVSGPGVINSTTGVFTSATEGTSIVQVTDSTSAIAQATANCLGPIELLCDIISSELGLDPSRVWIWDQKVDEPTDSGLFIVLSVISDKHFGNSNQNINGNAVQSTNVFSTVQIDIKSRDTSAFTRKEEVTMALNSDYAQLQSTMNSFSIATKASSIVNLSEVDGSAIPYRFTFTVGLQYFIMKTKAVPYFDTFGSPSVITNS